VVTLITEAFGIVPVMARGVRKGSRRFPGAVPPFALLETEIGLGQGEVGRLAEAVPRRSFPLLLADLDRMRAVGQQLDWLRRLLPPRQRDPEVFRTVVDLLAAVADRPGQEARGLEVAFRARVAALLGLEPNLERCAGCGRAPRPGQAARFDPAAGGIVCRACGGGPIGLSGPARTGLLEAVRAAWTEAFRPTSVPSPAVNTVRDGGPDPIADADHAVTAFLDYHARR
jgi:DNA repair protein RecO (recombination protein O)